MKTFNPGKIQAEFLKMDWLSRKLYLIEIGMGKPGMSLSPWTEPVPVRRKAAK